MKRKFTNYLMLVVMSFVGKGLMAQNVFLGLNANMNDPTNWSVALPDGITAANEDITFNGISAAQIAITNNLVATTRNRISFLAGANTKTITGSSNTFQLFGATGARILNTSGTNQIISFPLELNGDLEINTIGANTNTLTFNGDISAIGGTRTITINAGGNVTFNGNISGTINIIKTGTGNLTFTGAKTFTGTMNVTGGGVVTINDDMGCERITVGSGTTFRIIKAGLVTLANLFVEPGSVYALTTSTTVVNITDTLSIGATSNAGSNATSQFTYGNTAVLVYAFPSGAQTVRAQEWKVGTFDIVANRPNDVIIRNAPDGQLNLPGTFPAGNLNRSVNRNFTVTDGSTIALGLNQLDVLGNMTCLGTGSVVGGQRANLTLNKSSISTLRMKPRDINSIPNRHNNFLRLLVLRDTSKLTLLDTLVISASTDGVGSNRGSLQLIGAGTQLDATDQLLVLESNANGFNPQITTVFSALPVPIVGDIVMERFIPSANPMNGRGWRLISLPFVGSRPLGKNLAGEDWPLNRVNGKDASAIALPTQTAGKGTVVTGRFVQVAQANAWGFDSWSSLSTNSNSSIRKFTENPSPADGGDGGNFSGASPVNSFTSLATNPLSTILDNIDQGYMLFVRGDRTITEPGSGPTNLRFVGTRNNGPGTIPISGTTTSEHVVFGNPYACDFSIQALVAANPDSILNTFWFWDANINEFGGWRFINQVAQDIWFVDGTDNIQSAYAIAAGQAVLLITTWPDPTVLMYNENMKATEIPTSGVRPFEEGFAASLPSVFGIKYYREIESGVNVLLNGTAVLLNDKYTNGYDVRKDISMVNPLGTSYNLSIVNQGKYLAMDGRKDFKAGDKIEMWTGGLKVGNFSFQFKPLGLQSVNLEAFLVDKFLATETRISLTDSVFYNYVVTSEVASSDPQRFEVIFKEASVLPVNFTGITAEEAQGNVNVKWNTATERGVRHYEIQHSVNGRDFGKAGIVNARNLGAANYTFQHQQPGNGNHFYRVMSEDLDGQSTLSQVVKVNIGNGKPAFTVFPTLIRENRVTLQFTGLTKGRYTLQLSDMSGKVLLSQNVDHNGGSASQSLVLPASLSKGSYNLKLSGENTNFNERIIKQ